MTTETMDPKPAKWATDFAQFSQHWMVAMLFWKNRHRCPDLAVTISQSDVDGFQQSLGYNDQEPIVVVDVRRPFMPGEKVARNAAETEEDRQKTYIAIRVVDRKTKDPIVINENNEADLQRGEALKQLRRQAEMAPNLVQRLRSEDQAGLASRQSIDDVCNALLALSKAVL